MLLWPPLTNGERLVEPLAIPASGIIAKSSSSKGKKAKKTKKKKKKKKKNREKKK